MNYNNLAKVHLWTIAIPVAHPVVEVPLQSGRVTQIKFLGVCLMFETIELCVILICITAILICGLFYRSKSEREDERFKDSVLKLLSDLKKDTPDK